MTSCIGSLFFRLDYLLGLFPGLGFRQSHPDRALEKVPESDLYFGNTCPQRIEIDILSIWRVQVVRSSRYSRRVVLDCANLVVRLQNAREQRLEIKPFVRRVLDRPVVDIEPINIDAGSHGASLEKAKAPEGALHPTTEAAGGVVHV